MKTLSPMMRLWINFGLGAILLWSVIAAAQAKPASTNVPAGPPPGTQLIPAGSNGEVVVSTGNYWDGVDENNDLHVMVSTYPVLNDAGRMVNTKFAPSVNFIDMNNDDLKDLVVGDTYGFLWIYFNSGEKGKPLFTTGTRIPTFLGWASKIHVVDWDNDGDNDIVVGAFYGDIVVFVNTGSAKQPRLARAMGIPRYVSPYYSVDDQAERLRQIRLGNQPMLLGIYMSPWVTDWNNDGKQDLIIGEGTYSANSIRIALNKGSRSKPVFVPDRVFYLAYGEGFEQLTPAVVDYNGDEIPDLMCGTRTGQIRLYKGTKKPVEGADIVSTLKGTKAPASLEFDRFLPIAGKNVFDTMTIPYPCDWNEDGLFDILLGSTKGIIYVALNKGTKSNPSFPAVQVIKGTNMDKDYLAPVGWWNGIGHSPITLWYGRRLDYVGDKCNAAVLLSAEKKAVLKPGLPPIIPVAGQYFMYFRYDRNYLGWTSDPKSGTISIIGGRVIGLASTIPLEIGKRYELSFSSIMLGSSGRMELVGWEIFPGTDVIRTRWERLGVEVNIAPSVGWQKRSKTFVCPGKQKGRGKQPGQIVKFWLLFVLPKGDCKFCLDDISLKEVVRGRR